MSNPTITKLLDLRILVLSPGEFQHFGWWNSQFLSITGLSFLERVFPRIKFSAAFLSATRAAQISHDMSIGRGEGYPFISDPIDGRSYRREFNQRR